MKIRVLVENGDLIISKKALRRAGIREGDVVSVDVISKTETAKASPKNVESLAILRTLWGLWSEEDEERFRREREEMWRSWQTVGW